MSYQNDMREAVIPSGLNQAEPDGTDPSQAESMPIAMGGEMFVNQRRQSHPLHLFEQQRDVVDAF